MQRHFIATHELPPEGEPAEARARLERLAVASRRRGVRPIETFVAPSRSRGVTYFEADSEQSVRDLLHAAGLPASEVVPGERVHTELLDEPNPSRRT